MIPLCLNACQHMTWHVSAQVARTDSRAFVFKSASKVSPPLSLFGSHFISLLAEVSHDEAKMRDLC